MAVGVAGPSVGMTGKTLDIVPASGKIYDITHADNNEHSVPLPAGYPENTQALSIRANRVSGSGVFVSRSVSGQTGVNIFNNESAGLWIRAVDGLFYYNLNTPGDDWDIYAMGYVIG